VQQAGKKYCVCLIVARKCIILNDKSCYFALQNSGHNGCKNKQLCCDFSQFGTCSEVIEHQI
jgi:hypothetical protein